jgi:hypothetical protein
VVLSGARAARGKGAFMGHHCAGGAAESAFESRPV